jgi:hypothetical protein
MLASLETIIEKRGETIALGAIAQRSGQGSGVPSSGRLGGPATMTV